MSQRRTLILAAAIIIGALASFLVWNYVNGVQDEAFSNAEQVPVYMVKQGIPRGTPGLEAQAYIAKENIPRKFKPGNAITNIEDISGKVAVGNLVANQVVVADMFVDASDPSARASFAEKLTKIRSQDQVAVTINLDEVRGVAGLIAPGDYVNIMVTKVVQVGTADPASDIADSEEILFAQQARFLYQKVEVLAIGKTTVPEAGASADTSEEATATNTGLITLIVPSRAAQYIASVPSANLYLALVASDYEPVVQDPIDLNDLLPGEDPDRLTPYGKEGPDNAS
ncbi:MAG: Flp pilus assembly protein CpaB [Acidimicrobiales bacterium]|nr:Flp pilus assembly protein CpaB [Acidimicrobiales bacterium]